MKRIVLVLWLVPVALAVIFCFHPPRGDDAFHHSVNAVEHVRAWSEGEVFPRYYRAWNGGTGSFVPTIQAPVSQAVQGGLAWLVGDGQRAVGISLAAALLVTAVGLFGWSREAAALLVVLTPYFMAVALSRSTTTEAWALAGAATVLPLALPPVRITLWRGLGLAAGVILVAGCQVGMLLQLGWLLGVAWAVSILLGRMRSSHAAVERLREPLETMGWGMAGLATAGVLWIPAVVDGRHLAMAELVSGPLDWRQNFLPDSSELGLLLSATALSLVVIVVIVIVQGEGEDRLPLAAAVAFGVILSTPLSAPLWHLPKMEYLQFPWRSLGPATLVAVLALASLRGRWRAVSITVLLLPLAFLPIRLGSGGDAMPTKSTPKELALIAQQRWGLVPTLPSFTGLYAPGFHRLGSLERLTRQGAHVEVIARDVGGGTWQVTSRDSGWVLLPLQWWPEWRIEAGGRELAVSNGWGLVAVELDAGTVEVHASLAASRSRATGALLSVAGLAALLILTIRWVYDRRPAPTSRGAT